ncbi:N-acetyltransferase [Marinomonas sp. PE14-40]|uniref:N-acetyltransferase n=1 Tax=Marinomonas sp. PE14-40 TaxID=3060621 RepID=UPI003F67B410
MKEKIEYIKFDDIDQEAFLPLVNSQRVREHLMEHALFTLETLTQWMATKRALDNEVGCKARGILCDGELAGWCAIQYEESQYEIAIIIDDRHWGLGKNVFKDMMGWAREFKHEYVYIHFLHTRPEYRFLKKIAKSVQETELYGNKFISYQLAVE